MAFFGASGPGSLTGAGQLDLDQQKTQAILAKMYPQLGPPQQQGQAPQSPTSIAQLGYGGQGPQLYYGQGQAGSNPFSSVNSLFERSAGSTADSITSALSSGQTGPTYSGAQQGVGTAALPPTGGGGIQGGPNLASLSTAGYGMSPGAPGGLVPDTGTGATTLNTQPGQTIDVAGLANQANNAYQGLNNLTTSQTSGSSPALTAQRQGEIQPNGLPTGQTQNAVGGGLTTQGYNFSTLQAPDVLSATPVGGGQGTFSLFGNEQAQTLNPADYTLGTNTQLDLNTLPTGLTQGEAGGGFQLPSFGGALNTGAAVLGGLGGIQGIIGGAQSGNPLQSAAGGAATIGSLNQLFNQPGSSFANAFPELSSELGTASNALGALGGAYGLYQGIQGGSPFQALGGAAGLYSGAAPLINQAFDLTGSSALPSLSSLATGGVNAAANALGYTGSLTGDIGSGVSGLLGGAGAGIGAGISSLGDLAGLGLAGAPTAALNYDASSQPGAQTYQQIADYINMIPVVGTLLAPVLGVGEAINQALNPVTNYQANKLAGQVGPSVTAGLEQMAQPQNFSGMDQNSLGQYLQQAGTTLLGQYSGAGAGLGTSTSQTGVSRYEQANPQQAQQNIQGTEQNMLQAIAQLQQQGVSQDVIGGLLNNQIGAIGNDFGNTAPGLQSFLPQGAASLYNPSDLASMPYGTGSYGSNLNSPYFNANALGGSTYYLLNQLGITPQQAQQAGVTLPGLNQQYLQQYQAPQPGAANNGLTPDQVQQYLTLASQQVAA